LAAISSARCRNPDPAIENLMPGIFGIIDTSRAGVSAAMDELVEMVRHMASAMDYDSAYVTDVVSSPELGACVGRVGFADNAEASDEPRRSPVALLLAGEAFPISGNADPEADDARCVGRGAAEVFQILRRSGEEALADVNGAFAGVLIDSRGRRCVVFNDRFGMERIFVHTDGPKLLFASEAKAILAVAPRTREFDPRALGEIFGCGGTLTEQSLYQGVEVLPGGASLTLRPGIAPVKRVYFDRSRLETTPATDGDTFLRTFPEILARAVNAVAAPGPAAGISLTGGLDSRMIVATLSAPPATIPCYTFGSMYRETKDVEVAKAVAARIGHPFEVLTLDAQFLSNLPAILDQAAYISDGYLGLSGAAELYLNRRAREIAPVRLTGNWGGESLRGVRAFKFAEPKGGFLVREVSRSIAVSARLFDENSCAVENALSYSLFRQMPLQGYGRYAVERSQMRMRAPFLDNDVVRALYSAPPSVRASHQCSVAVISKRPELLSIPTDMGVLGTGPEPVQLARRLQRKVVVKAEYLISHGAPDWLAALTSSALGDRLERFILGRNKFQHFRRWMRRELASYVRDTLVGTADASLDAWFDLKRVALMVEDNIAGRGNYSDEIDNLLTVASVRRSLL
jgi:asparagine synthase (glutamine-hydrolysing)